MKKLVTFFSFLFLAIGICHGATKKDEKKGQQQAEEAKARQEALHKPTGPVGLGSIKIGMQMEEVIQLQESDGVYLTEPLTDYKTEFYIPKPGIYTYSAKIAIPAASKPLESVFTFSSNQLTEIYVNFKNSPYLYDKFKDQVTDKYGQGNIKDKRKEEQCIYKNGANFKLITGDISTIWVQSISVSETIETTLSEIKYDRCYSDLRYKLPEVETKGLTIRKIDKGAELKKGGLF